MRAIRMRATGRSAGASSFSTLFLPPPVPLRFRAPASRRFVLTPDALFYYESAADAQGDDDAHRKGELPLTALKIISVDEKKLSFVLSGPKRDIPMRTVDGDKKESLHTKADHENFQIWVETLSRAIEHAGSARELLAEDA